MLKVLAGLLVGILTLFVLQFIDRKIKGTHSVVTKVISVLLVTGFIAGFIYLNGEALLNSFGVNLKSFTNIKGFIAKQFIVIFLLAILFLIIVFSMRSIVLLKKEHSEKKISSNEESLETVVFDMNVVPNINNIFSRANSEESIVYNDGFSFANLAKEGN